MKNKSTAKLLLIAVNNSWYQSNPALYYLREVIRDLDYEIRLRSFTVSDLPLEVLRATLAERPEILCFSAYIWNRVYLEALLPDLKALLPQARFVIGGPEAGHLASLADLLILGPGEAKFRRLAELGFPSAAQIPEPQPIPLKDLGFPYRPEDLDELSGKLLYYETSRGCPFSCAYCLSALDDRNERRFDPDDPEDLQRLSVELDALEALQPRTVKFVDRSFNLDPSFARALWGILLSKSRDCEWHFEIYPDLLTEEDIVLLESAPEGLIRFETGIQSCDDSINLACGRFSDWNKSKAMLQALRDRTHVVVHADLLCGLPEQSFEDVLRSIDELAPCLPEEIQLGMLKLLPDTPMRDIAESQGWIWSQSPPYPVLKTERMDFDELRLCEDLARVLNLYWNKGEFKNHWPTLLQSVSARTVLFRLLDWHREHGLNLHSISKGKREDVFREALL